MENVVMISDAEERAEKPRGPSSGPVLLKTLVVVMALLLTACVAFILVSQIFKSGGQDVYFPKVSENFTVPKDGHYRIRGLIITTALHNCKNTFRLQLFRGGIQSKDLFNGTIGEKFVHNAKLKHGDKLRIRLNCNTFIETSSMMVYQKM